MRFGESLDPIMERSLLTLVSGKLSKMNAWYSSQRPKAGTDG